jgi:hypothetical protein
MKMIIALGGAIHMNIPLLIGFQVKPSFTAPNSKYKILDSRIRLK